MTAAVLDVRPANWSTVEAAGQGDREAFGLLYGAYQDRVYKFIYFRVGSRWTAEDIAADVFMRALTKLDTVEWMGRDIGAWLLTVARNLVADYFKSARYRLTVLIDAGVSAETGMHNSIFDRQSGDDVEASVGDYLTSVTLMDAVRQLNAEQQEVVVLRLLRGLSVAETAAVMGKNEGAIKALQYRATRTLARLLPEGLEL